MAWYCTRCDDFLVSVGEDYCDDCKRIRKAKKAKRKAKRKAQKKAKRKIQEKVKEEKNARIREEIREYKDSQLSRIEEKYGAFINLDLEEDLKVLSARLKGQTEYEDIEKASKVQILYPDDTIKYEIYDLEEEEQKLKEAIEELENIKHKSFKVKRGE